MAKVKTYTKKRVRYRRRYKKGNMMGIIVKPQRIAIDVDVPVRVFVNSVGAGAYTLGDGAPTSSPVLQKNLPSLLTAADTEFFLLRTRYQYVRIHGIACTFVRSLNSTSGSSNVWTNLPPLYIDIYNGSGPTLTTSDAVISETAFSVQVLNSDKGLKADRYWKFPERSVENAGGYMGLCSDWISPISMTTAYYGSLAIGYSTPPAGSPSGIVNELGIIKLKFYMTFATPGTYSY